MVHLIITERNKDIVTIRVTADERNRRHPLRFAAETIGRLADLWRYRELIRNLLVRDLKVRYKNSAFGFAWSLLNPLFMMVVLSVVFSLVFERQRLVENFPAFLVVGLIPWNFTNTSLNRAVNSVVENNRLINKVYFPREVIPIAVVLANLVHFVLAIPVLLVILIALGVMPNPKIILLPPLILIHMELVLGIALLISCVNVFYRDMGVAMDVLMQGWFFATPIIYHHWILPVWLQKPAMANPLAAIITAYRDVLLFGRFPDRGFTLGALLSSTIIFVIGYAVFTRYAPLFAEEV
jgi:ABC-type polysaccharide/polyol phosphate export permease